MEQAFNVFVRVNSGGERNLTLMSNSDQLSAI